MTTAEHYENCWTELLKASRGWQIQYDPHELLTDVCRTARELLQFDTASAFLLEHSGQLTEGSRWPEHANTLLSAEAKLDVANSVVRTGRPVFMQKTIEGKPATILCAPLTASREILGALYLMTQDQQHEIGDKDQQFFQMLASQAAASLEHALLYQSAITDPLTGLFCHRHFLQEVDQAVRRAIRNEEPVTLLLMDLDHFKELNDSCGHEAGNQCLLQVTSILRSTFRSTDILARFGGDEFEIVMLDTGAHDAEKVAERVREAVAAIALPQKRHVTATIGIASFPTNAFSAQPLFLAADAALYAAKEAGRNRILCSSVKPGETPAADSNSRERAVRLLGNASDSAALPAVSPPKRGAIEMVDGHIVKKRLGVGSMGEVLLVSQPGLDRDVALKRPLTSHLSFEQMQTFEQEAKITASLNHPGIVPIFNIGRDHDSRRYYTMKPLDGPTLGQIIEARRKGEMEMLHEYTPGRLLEILQRVSETVAYAHARNVLHLDLTPGNIIIGKFGEVTVIDWATGSQSHCKVTETQSVKLVGSPSYIAPEMIHSPRNSSPAADVFALGTLLYLLLTDELPFHRKTTSESLDALLSGALTPPDVLKPESGIDAMLSALCVEALASDPKRRPSTQQFAQRLGLYLRGELDWTTIQFGPGGHALREDEWQKQKGTWNLDDGAWVSRSKYECALFWKVPVPGSFRFVCEAWADHPKSELTVIGHASLVPEKYLYSGYWFQVGAEYNTVHKLARHDNDVLVKAGPPVEPGRRYRLELEYQDSEGLVHCAINGKRVFTYRELFPFPGSHLGFYSFVAGTHFKPLELKRQNWNVQIPALRAADRHMQHGHFTTALECYQEIAANLQGRPQGSEATLKAGICHANLNQPKEALAAFDRTAGTIFEPFALAERAIYEARTPELGAVRSLATFRDLFQRFPESQARERIFDASRQMFWAINSTPTREQAVSTFFELNLQSVLHFNPPAQSQFSAIVRAVTCLAWLGRWNEALEQLLNFRQRLSPGQLQIHDVNAPLIMLSLALDRPDIFPELCETNVFRGFPDWPTGVILHHAIHWNKLADWKASCAKEDLVALITLFLAERNLDAARAELTRYLTRARADNDVGCWRDLFLFAESGQKELFELAADKYKAVQWAPPWIKVFRALLALQEFDLEKAAALLLGLREPKHYMFGHIRIFLQALLASLGLFNDPSLEELRASGPTCMCGPALDLVRMFTGEREPVPNELWPSPRWHPEWRLLLGIWLEAKGRRKEARDLVAPARDPRYGWTHSQPGIELLLKRTTPG